MAAFFTQAGYCFMIINILKVAGFDGCIKTHFYGATYIPAGVLVKLRKVSIQSRIRYTSKKAAESIKITEPGWLSRYKVIWFL